MKYTMIVDTNRCSLCYACVVACKDEFVGNPYLPYSFSQLDKGHSWISLLEVEKGNYPNVRVYPIPILCMHCEKAPCITACSITNCIYKTNDGVVIIDPSKCNGCKSCIDACPYGAIYFNDDKNICQKCTLCVHRLAQGKIPACVDACPSDVFLFGEESKLSLEVTNKRARWLHPEHRTKPRVFYIGLPSPSIAGHLIDEQSLMDVPDANITIMDIRTGSHVTCKSNLSGNFLAEELQMGMTYAVKIECKEYIPQTLNVQINVEYKHIGDIKLYKIARIKR
jgi:tetrathionate reductase subunit B